MHETRTVDFLAFIALVAALISFARVLLRALLRAGTSVRMAIHEKLGSNAAPRGHDASGFREHVGGQRRATTGNPLDDRSVEGDALGDLTDGRPGHVP